MSRTRKALYRVYEGDLTSTDVAHKVERSIEQSCEHVVHKLVVVGRYLWNEATRRAVADPYTIVWVNPKSIATYTREFGAVESIGAIRAGDWDLEARSFSQIHESTDMTAVRQRAILARYRDGMEWEETGVHNYISDQHENTSVLNDRYDERDSLYRSMQREGYRVTKNEQPPSLWDVRSRVIMDCPSVHIGRDGAFVFAKGFGNHRFGIAKIVDLDEIPVWVRVRHAKWQAKREEIANAAAPSELSEETRGLLTHPDMQDIVPSEWTPT